MLILVTGVNGFVGSNVCRSLLLDGYKVRGSVRDPEDKANYDFLLKKNCIGDNL